MSLMPLSAPDEIRARPLTDVLRASSAAVRPSSIRVESTAVDTVPVINIYNDSYVTADNINRVPMSAEVLEELRIPYKDRFYLMGIWNGCLNSRVSADTVQKIQDKKALEASQKLEKVVGQLTRESAEMSTRLDRLDLEINGLKDSIRRNSLGPSQVTGVLTRRTEDLVNRKMDLEFMKRKKDTEIAIATDFFQKLKKKTSVVHEVMTEYSKSIKGFNTTGAMLRSTEVLDQYTKDVENTSDLMDQLEVNAYDPLRKKAVQKAMAEILGSDAVPMRYVNMPPASHITSLSDQEEDDYGGGNDDAPPDGDLDTSMLLDTSREARKNVKAEEQRVGKLAITL